ncbi:hypothetical protein ACFLV2_02520 [Chloroflexota bacterium]
MNILEKILEKLNMGKGDGKRKKQSKRAMSFDLLYQLSYMSVIAAGGVPRSKVFERAAQLPCSSAEYFRKIELTCRRLKYDYARACRVIGESAEEEEIKGLLLRFSGSLISGEPEAEFLAREAEAQTENYYNEYGRNLESLKMLTDAYVSLILSAVLVIIIGIVSTMIWTISAGVIIGMAFLSILTTALGVWLIYLVAPKEISVLSWAGSKEQKLAKKLFKYFIPAAGVISMLVLVSGNGLGIALLVIAALVFPIGFIVNRDDGNISKRDAEVGVFLRALGGACAALGTTANAALARLDIDSINVLRVTVKRLNTRITAGIRTRVCWKKFIDETGSELANRSVGMFYDTIELGGSAGEAGYQASLFASKIALLRARRRTVSGPFRWLCITMHGSIIALLVFITEIVMSFAGMVAQAEETLPKVSGAASMASFTSFNLTGLDLMHQLILPLVVIFTVTNAIAPGIAEGGSWYKFFSNLSITAAISGGALVFLPSLTSSLFSSV